jgi:hypothetical protein
LCVVNILRVQLMYLATPGEAWTGLDRHGQAWTGTDSLGQAWTGMDRHGEAPTATGGWGSQISRQSTCEGNMVVSLTHRPPLSPRKYSWGWRFITETCRRTHVCGQYNLIKCICVRRCTVYEFQPSTCVLSLTWETKFHTHKTSGKITIPYFYKTSRTAFGMTYDNCHLTTFRM